MVWRLFMDFGVDWRATVTLDMVGLGLFDHNSGNVSLPVGP